jgi:hypothetical protein
MPTICDDICTRAGIFVSGIYVEPFQIKGVVASFSSGKVKVSGRDRNHVCRDKVR